MSSQFIYQCVDCGKEYSGGEIMYLCPKCANKPSLPPKGVLKVLYDYDHLKQTGLDFDKLIQSNFLDLLPIKTLSSLPHLKVGNTPLYRINQLEDKVLPFEILIKDDSQNPTFSFKDRASSLVSAFAKEHGIKTIITASTGNAGSSIAGICAAQKQKSIVVVPSSAPIAKLTQIIMYGATIIPVEGTYDDAFELSLQATELFGWYNRNTAYNPITIEGKKTVAFELFDQLDFSLPDRIFVPVGDGVIISGVYKGFEDLLKLNIIQAIPTIVAVQAEGSDNLVRNLDNYSFLSKKSQTIADSISVNFPRNFYMTKAFIHQYHGQTVTVSDHEILDACAELAKNTGLFSEPASAAAYAGFLKFQTLDKINPGSKNVVLLTGSGLKDIQSVKSIIKLPDSIQPDIKEMEKFVKLSS
jgi:threonine synthase